MKKILYIIPVILVAGLFVFFWRGLQLEPQRLPSTLIDKPAPAFHLPSLGVPGAYITEQDLRSDKITLFHVWATWCMYCRAEHPVLMKIAEQQRVNLIGLNYHDQLDKAHEWLNTLGNPYAKVAFDNVGQVGIDYGVYGTPETFIIDHNGIIRDKIIGPITWQSWQHYWLPLIEALEQEI